MLYFIYLQFCVNFHQLQWLWIILLLLSLFLILKENENVWQSTRSCKFWMCIARHVGVAKSTIREIESAMKRIKKTADLTLNASARRIISSHSKPFILVEASLVTWIERCRMKDVGLDRKTIKNQSRRYAWRRWKHHNWTTIRKFQLYKT